ncbi:gamma-glutamylcyclotransferase [Lysobacter sp. K5869]|uniref:gamma-glutamylcyclotransferase family protein n=1 Tax=Lysobacter sp. K5869 TaxID=2820808 RepID=UPI001C060EF0|nr:gamma-glutamylcyclotransferase [Lysobacter sp. K5869]QWP75413.1 gamma-glutamylcyclotransferase [Lysobacter sp. K5869]
MKHLTASELAALARLNRARADGGADAAEWEAHFAAAYSADRRLAVYGTLAPGQPNHHHLSDLAGRWIAGGAVTGTLEQIGWGADLGYPALRWSADGGEVAVQLFASDELPAHWPRLDEFEGEQYLRILVPVRFADGRIEVANLYAAHPAAE